MDDQTINIGGIRSEEAAMGSQLPDENTDTEFKKQQRKTGRKYRDEKRMQRLRSRASRKRNR